LDFSGNRGPLVWGAPQYQSYFTEAGVATIGVISDTHGLLRPEAMAALRGSDLVLHAGDVGAPWVIESLQALAPVFAVRGNVDRASGLDRLPVTQAVQVDGLQLYVLHDLSALDLDPAVAGFVVVVSGHSHQPRISTSDGILYLNPGSAGPRRFNLPVTVARLHVGCGAPNAEIIDLKIP